MRLLAVVLALLMSACASVRNTPAQDRAQEAWTACSGAGGARLDYIEPDGTIHFTVTASQANILFMQECLAQKRLEGSRAAFVGAPVKTLVYKAYFTPTAPPSGFLSTAPAETDTFTVDHPVPFFLNLNKSGRVVTAKFKWYRPGGQLDTQQDRVLHEGTGTHPRYWIVQILPSRQVQHVGRWAMELYLDDELIDRYEFSVTR